MKIILPIKIIGLQLLTIEYWTAEFLSAVCLMAVGVFGYFGGFIYQDISREIAPFIFIFGTFQFSFLLVNCTIYNNLRCVASLLAGSFWIWYALYSLLTLHYVIILLLGLFNVAAFISCMLINHNKR